MNQEYLLLQEDIAHGNAMFPLMVHEVISDNSFRERIGCHWHHEIELLVVTRGQAEMNIDQRSYPVQKDSIIFIPSNCLHSATTSLHSAFDFFAVDFDPALLNSFVNDSIQQKYFDSLSNGEIAFPECITPQQEWEVRLLHMLEDIRMIFTQKEAAYELLIKARLYEIWYLLCSHAQKTKADAPANTDYQITIIKAVIEYIKDHYDSPIFLDTLSHEFNISKGHLCRLFRSITKMSLVEYMNFYRISKSASLLAETHREISEIAGMTGFNNISYYNKIFRKYMHMTPSQFRRSSKQSKAPTV